tara:strand:+ start:21315 stop:22862 length:1548 start_codon:yes stop_codon:yes gene_type:complete
LKKLTFLLVGIVLISSTTFAQTTDQMVESIISEATENSHLKKLAHDLMDVVGPRLVGTTQMQNAHNWAVSTFEEWDITAQNQEWGQWQGWERGITHVDLLEPRVVTLEGMQMAWSPSTKRGGVNAEVIHLPMWENEAAFKAWLPSVKGKIVLVSMPQPTGRPDYNWEEFATEESFKKMKEERNELSEKWNENISKTGFSSRTLVAEIEKAGAAAIFQSRWSSGFGVNKIFGAQTTKIAMIDISLEDYGLLWRLSEFGNKPKVKLVAESKDLGKVPTFNTIATIPGTKKPEEYVILSAHFDSWDGGTGATDNGTGTITMMEAARILKTVYPNPKRTIIVGLWGSEEQGLNGSGAFAEDHPEITNNVQAVFNQDNGTGRVVRISGQGFLHAYDFIGDWLEAVPREYKSEIETTFPGTPASGGSDYASFLSRGAPAFSLSSLSWSYGTYTWHTNRDTYDKIVFDDVQNNAILTAIMAYMASEDPDQTPRDKAVLGINPRNGEQRTWPTPRTINRDGGN